MSSLDIRFIKSIGARRAAAFKKLGVHTVDDLLAYYPRAYEDRTRVYSVAELADGQTRQFCAEAAGPVRESRLRDGLTLYKATVFDETGEVTVSFFNMKYIGGVLQPGKRFLFYGKASRFGKTLEVNTPDMTPLLPGESPAGSIVPIYPLTEGLTGKIISSAVRSALEISKETIIETLPANILEAYNLNSLAQSMNDVHRPQSFAELARARRRLVFEELFYMSLGLLRLRARRGERPGIKFTVPDFSDFYGVLPFEPTQAQRRAIDEGAADMASGVPMNRLIQGDVGSGKTLVAAALAWAAAQNGYQTAVMAPTEILAAQHFSTFTKIFDPLGFKCALLSGGLGATQKRDAINAAASGETDILIGTQALLSGPVTFKALGLSVFDEQHRFSVRQRYTLAAKGGAPHSLIMSATPIPRTLALIVYGDLDVSALAGALPGRQKIDTFCVGEKMRPRIEAFVRKQVGEGRQAYIICPLVEDGAEADVKSIESHAEDLKNRVYRDLYVGVLHGRMSPPEKESVMNLFASGALDVLVSTTVIEVGVDVPNASLIVIENAERFGLSQLHQLRGRVGRGSHKSYCVMFYGGGSNEGAGGGVYSGGGSGGAYGRGGTAGSPNGGAVGAPGSMALARMEILCNSNDGFAIAEKDLELRGPGEFFGMRQHGLPGLKLASLVTDMDILKEAQAAARNLLDEDPDLSERGHLYIEKKLAALFGGEAWAF